jgi:hypothetical protein
MSLESGLEGRIACAHPSPVSWSFVLLLRIISNVPNYVRAGGGSARSVFSYLHRLILLLGVLRRLD